MNLFKEQDTGRKPKNDLATEEAKHYEQITKQRQEIEASSQ
jgi:hypothetical protein